MSRRMPSVRCHTIEAKLRIARRPSRCSRRAVSNFMYKTSTLCSLRESGGNGSDPDNCNSGRPATILLTPDSHSISQPCTTISMVVEVISSRGVVRFVQFVSQLGFAHQGHKLRLALVGPCVDATQQRCNDLSMAFMALQNPYTWSPACRVCISIDFSLAMIFSSCWFSW